MRRSAYAGIGLAVLALGAAGCGSDNNDNSSASTPSASTPAAPATSTPAASTPAAAAGGGAVTLSETEFKIAPKAATAKAGKVTIDVKNAGQTVHNLNVEGNGIEEKKTADLQPGDSGKLTLDLKPGKYEMYCSIDGHRASGMEGTITVS
jgi:uncharacterized cupredoxin-like copper-binding protein